MLTEPIITQEATKSSPRRECLLALEEWQRQEVFADEILHRRLESSGFEPRNRGLLAELFYGILRQMRLLDHWIGHLRNGRLDNPSRDLLRMGLYQLFFTRIPDHASVSESVRLARREQKGLINAVLQRAIREREILKKMSAEAGPGIRWSQPDFLIERWTREFGPENAAALAAWNNEPAEVFGRLNRLKARSLDELQPAERRSPVEGRPDCFRISGPVRAWVQEGMCYLQDPSTLAACELLDPQPGERVLDACAAPGGKTVYLAQRMNNQGDLVACDSVEARLDRLKGNISRMGVRMARVICHDWLAEGDERTNGLEPDSFDRILVDAPCTNTGVMRRRVDVRWRLRPDDFPRMAGRQIALTECVLKLLRPGGRLVFSTCSIDREENQGVAATLLARNPGLRLVEERQSLPFRDRVDGAYAALFERVAAKE